MLRREIVAFAALTLFSSAAAAQETVKIGLILPMTGQQASTGKQIDAAVKLYQARNGTTVAGKKVEVILKDDTGVPDVAKRLAQELVVNDKVAFLAGFGLTPIALAVAPIATQAKVPEVVMAAGTSSITEASPFVVRTSFTLAQSAVPMAEWAVKNGIKKVVTLVTDFGPGIDAEKYFQEAFKKAGGEIVGEGKIIHPALPVGGGDVDLFLDGASVRSRRSRGRDTPSGERKSRIGAPAARSAA
jgi:branched-chain amino acid transport system substrate-binding protein